MARAYVTILSDNSYINGVVVLHRSLVLSKAKYPLFCIVTPEVSEENRIVLQKLGIWMIEKDLIMPPSSSKEEALEVVESLDCYGSWWHKALVKLHIFGLTQFSKLVYIDADMVVKQNIDDLFEKSHMTAAWDCFGFGANDICNSGSFNSGLLVVEPSTELYEDLMRFFNTFDGGGKLIHDQWVLQEYFKDWPSRPELHLDRWWAPWTTAFVEDRDEYYYLQSQIKVLHIIDRKPWTQNRNYFITRLVNWPCYAKLCLQYIDILNYTITDLKNKGITSPDLKIIY